MNDFEYIKALTDIDDKYINEAKQKKKKIISVKKIAMVAIAAVLCVVLILSGIAYDSGITVKIDFFDPNEYVFFESNEEGICYIPLSTIRREDGAVSAEARNIAFSGTAVFTDENGEYFDIEYKKYDTVSLVFKSAVPDTHIQFGLVSNGIFEKPTLYDGEALEIGGFPGMGIRREYDEDTSVSAYITSDEVVYLEYIDFSTTRNSYMMGESVLQYYVDGEKLDARNIEVLPYEPVVKGLIDIPLENAPERKVKIGCLVRIAFSLEATANLKAGDKVNIEIDLDGDDVRWTLYAYKVGDEWPPYAYEFSRDEDVNVVFDIPSDGDYIFELINDSANYLEIVDAKISIN